jgi:glyoxylase-like metal-dependent hydrolase (beta-lactamase superfamily II)
MRTSYRLENLQPLQAADRLELLDGEAEIAPGISVRVTGGHTPGHHVVLMRSGGETALFAADVCPTAHHLRGPYTMAYDLDPLTSIQVKRDLLAQAAAEGWTVFFDHEPVQKAVRITRDGDQFHAEAVDWAAR